MDSDAMGAAGAYLGLKQANILGQFQVGLARKIMDQGEEASRALIEGMMPKPSPNPPHLGSNIDRYV